MVTRRTFIDGQWFDSDRSDLSSNLMQVDTFFYHFNFFFFAINKAYF